MSKLEPILNIYTDGACKGNPGPGGWGAMLQCEDYKKEIKGASQLTTNNIMELTAVIESLKLIKNSSNEIHSIPLPNKIPPSVQL